MLHDMVTLEEFKKIEMRVGEILSAERIPDTDKLLRLSVHLGEETPRQIVSGIAEYFPDPGELVGKQCVFAANLEPRMIRGFESQGMIMAVTDEAGEFALLVPHVQVAPGARVR